MIQNARSNAKKVAIFDDDYDYASLLKERFEMRQIDAEICCNGLNAKEFLENSNYDCIVMDIKMPGLDGLSIVESLEPSIRRKVLVVSGIPDMRSPSLKLGVLGFLPKPIDIDGATGFVQDFINMDSLSI